MLVTTIVLFLHVQQIAKYQNYIAEIMNDFMNIHFSSIP